MSAPLLAASLFLLSTGDAPLASAVARNSEETLVASPVSPVPSVPQPRGAVLSTQPRWFVPSLHTGALMGSMRLSLSALWPDSYAPRPLPEMARHLRVAYTQPPEYDRHRRLFESDGDPWTLNVIGHGLFGSEVYQRFRQCGHSPLVSLGATTSASLLWEYGVESVHQRPSAVDLAWTPLSGVALGELRFQLFRAARGETAGSPGALRRAVMILLDPLGEGERALGVGC